MTKRDKPNDRKPVDATRVGTSPPGSPLRLGSFRPPPNEDELTLVALIGRVARCPHPRAAHSPAVVLEPNGSRMRFCWCGACGAMRLPDEDGIEWIRTGLAEVLGQGGHVALLEERLTSVAHKMAELAAAVRSLDGHPLDDELSSCVHEIQRTSVELERAARAALQGMREAH